MNTYATQWVCANCFILLVNGDISDDCENADDLLTKFEGFHAFPGMRSNEHAEQCREELQSGDYFDCDCECNTFSTSQCDGCGSYLHGERHAVTIKEKR